MAVCCRQLLYPSKTSEMRDTERSPTAGQNCFNQAAQLFVILAIEMFTGYFSSILIRMSAWIITTLRELEVGWCALYREHACTI